MTQAFIAVNITLSLLVAIWMQITTPRASIRASRHDPQAMWGMLRRLFYISMAVSLFGMAVYTAEGWIRPTRAEVVFWMMLVVPLIIFLGLRAWGVVDQDHWLGMRRHPKIQREKHPDGTTFC